MLSLVRCGRTFPLQALALALGIGAFAASSALADDSDRGDLNDGRFKHSNLENGTLGWAEYGLYPGLYGFSLRWHLGYGYGLYALGVWRQWCDTRFMVAQATRMSRRISDGSGQRHHMPILVNPITHSSAARTSTKASMASSLINLWSVSASPASTVMSARTAKSRPAMILVRSPVRFPYPETYFAPFASPAATTGSSRRMVQPNLVCLPHLLLQPEIAASLSVARESPGQHGQTSPNP